MTIPRLFPAAIFAILFAASAAAQNNFKLDLNFDPLLNIPECFEMSPEEMEAAFKSERFEKNPYFEWLTTDRDRAIFMRQPFSNLTVDITMFGGELPIEEAVVDFVDGKINGISISIYNRGDAGAIDKEEFDRRFKLAGSQMSARLGVRPFRRKANPTQGMLTEGWTWISAKGMAVVEHNPEVENGKFEFLRMRLMRRDATGAMAAAMQSRSGASVKLSDLPRNVKTDKNGNTVIQNIPMVDQGRKGYCVVASAQRLFEYYGIPCDQHQLAQIAGADASRGTSTLAMSEALGKIDHRFKTRFKPIAAMASTRRLHEVERDGRLGDVFGANDFLDEIKDYVDEGIPILWALELGRYPEEPAIAMQEGGGHMRMIIGYNEIDGRIVFTDSWGAGHEKKRMQIDHAYAATHGLFVMHPTTR